MRYLLPIAIVLAATSARADRAVDPDDDLAETDDLRAVPDGDAAALAARCPTRPGTTCGEVGVPTVDEVVGAAYVASGLSRDPARGWIRRGRLSALVPWVSVRAGRDASWDDRSPDVGHGASYEVRMTWRLDRLAFDARELQVASIEAARRRERRRLAARVIRVYFTWLRAHRATARDPRWGIHAAEAAAELDALTDGEFAKALQRTPGS